MNDIHPVKEHRHLMPKVQTLAFSTASLPPLSTISGTFEPQTYIGKVYSNKGKHLNLAFFRFADCQRSDITYSIAKVTPSEDWRRSSQTSFFL